jgi:GntR family transcriptional regulator, vanillate catabolism transcriptional regulator
MDPLMSTHLDHATQTLRELVVSGAFALDRKLGEEAVARALGLSRTPARIAMATLEREGLLVRTPRRGYRVRSFTLDEVAGAIDVRGELEGMAARLLAERGIAGAIETRLEAALAQSEAIIERSALDVADRLAWTQSNLDFHAALIEGSGNTALRAAFEQVIRVPLASPRAIIFAVATTDRSRGQLRRAHEDHVRVVEAIRARRGSRAAEIMRDHALRSSENKRRNFHSIGGEALLVGQSGTALVRDPPLAA